MHTIEQSEVENEEDEFLSHLLRLVKIMLIKCWFQITTELKLQLVVVDELVKHLYLNLLQDMEEQKTEALSQLKSLSLQGKNLQSSQPIVLTQEQQSLMSHHSQLRSEELSDENTQQEQSKMQRYIQDVLVNNWYGPETIIKEIIEIAQTGMLPNPKTWDMEYSHKLQLDAKKLLLEMAWMHKNKKDSGNTLNLTKIIYQQGLNNANF